MIPVCSPGLLEFASAEVIGMHHPVLLDFLKQKLINEIITFLEYR